MANELMLYDLMGNVREQNCWPIGSMPERMNRIVRRGSFIYEHESDVLYSDRSDARRPYTH